MLLWNCYTSDKEGWQPNPNIGNGWSVEDDGIFRIDPAEIDPWIESPALSISADNYNAIQINIASNAPDGIGAIYFKTSESPTYSEDKKVDFSVENDGNFKDYAIFMGQNAFWKGTITGIRVDPSDTGMSDNSDSIGFDFIRLIKTSWEFNIPGDKEGWQPNPNIGNGWSVEDDGIFRIDPAEIDPWIESPALSISADNYNGIQINMASNAPDGIGAIYFRTSESPTYSEDKKIDFPVENDGNFKDYLIPVSQNALWKGTITGIRVDPSNAGRSDNSDSIGFDFIRFINILTSEPIASAIVVDKNAWVSTSLTGDSQAIHIFNSPVGFLSATDGDTFLILSSGIAENIPGNPVDFESTDFSPEGYSGDTASVTLNFIVPTDANKLKFDFRFMSEEFPEFVGSSFNDFFSAYLTGSTGTDQISFDTNGKIINVNNNFFDPAITPAGTVFDGTTPKLTTTTDVTPGESISLKFELGDVDDGVYDTAVFLDNIRFESEGNGGTSAKADVSVTKHGPTSVEKGKEMTYTINYYNIEEAEADNIVVTDTLPNKAIFVEGSAQGGTYDSATHSVSWNLDSIQKFSGGSLSLSISIPDNNPEVEIGTTLINSVSISTTSEENDIQNNNWQWTTAVTGSSILPPNVDIEPLISNYKGVPKIDLNTPMTFTYHGDSTVYGVDINIHLNDGKPDVFETMSNIPGTNDWMFTKTFSPRYGFGTVTYTVNHYDGTSEIIDHNILIDPSGWVEDKLTGERIEGAIVTLKRFDTTLQQFVFVEPSDSGIDPHINPQTTDEYGGFGWMVSPGIYRVEVEKVGYYSEHSDVNIPPAVTDLAIKLEPLYVPDTTPPSSITNLQSTSGTTWINWTWTNPPDPDFNHTEIYLNGTFITNIPAPQNYYNATGLLPDTSYELSTRTVDTSGNINETWVNNTASTLPASGTTLNLYTGWNLISLPLMPENTGIASVLSPINGNYSIIWEYNASDTSDQWKKYDSSAPFGNDLTNMEPGKGYWIMMTSGDTLPISGTMPESNDIVLKTDWNLIGYNSLGSQPVADALSSISSNYTIVWAYDASDTADHWKKHDPGAPFGNDLNIIEPGKGYWIMMTSDDILET